MNQSPKSHISFDQHHLDAFLVQKACNLQYLTGFTGGEGLGLIFAHGNKVLLVDGRYTFQAKSEVYQEIEVLEYQHKTLWETIEKYLKDTKKIGLESETPLNLYQRLLERIPNKEWICKPDFFEQQRMVKTSQEIELLTKAADIANQSYLAMLHHVKPGISEIELSALLEYEMKKRGGQKVSFDVIVASGKRSAMPHGVASEKIIEPGDMITFDFGVLYRGYASDTTRTIALGQPTDPEAKKMYQIVLDAQMKAIDTVKENVLCNTVDAAARDYIDEKGYGACFKHSTGHGIGLEIHELPRISSECMLKLLPGMAITIEPGIYFEERFGVRIEDSLIVTHDGYKNLTSLAKKELLIL